MCALSVFDCFCGFGGLSLGAEMAKLNVIGGVDANEVAVQSYAQNFPRAHALHHDLLEESPRSILRNVGIRQGDVDVLIGGPPCQPYSINNHFRSTEDSRCELVQRYLEFVTTLRPKWLLMENVPAFASIERGTFFEALLRSLRDEDYHVDFRIYDATRFGVPQKRRRLIVLACSSRQKLGRIMKELDSRDSETVTVGDAIGDLPEVPASSVSYTSDAVGNFQKVMRQNAPASIQGHKGSGLGSKNLRRISHVPSGGNWRNIPRRLLPPGMRRAKLTDHTTRYGRLHAAKPAFTLLTKCDPHWGCFVHPTQDRVITVREAARLQSIPDRVQFPGTLTDSYKLIGNAVPPLLAKGILETIQ